MSSAALQLSPLSQPAPLFQRSLKAAIGCVGIGVHSGRRARLTLHPAPAGHGIVFRRTDLAGDIRLAAKFDAVGGTRLCTELRHAADPRVRIGTVEHLMAALAGAAIDNALIDIDAPELPILDGSAAPFLFLIDCAGIVGQAVPRRLIQVLRPVRVENGDAFAELRPQPYPASRNLDLALSIEFDSAAIGRQALSLTLTRESFRHTLAGARTFVLAGEIEQLRRSGLARGGSLDNAVVVDGARIKNPAGLRMTDEFVRHKMLDAVGDLALAGAPLAGRFIGHKSGHTLNNDLLRALFADAANWRYVPVESTGLAIPPAAHAEPERARA